MSEIKKEMQNFFGYTDEQTENLQENQIQYFKKIPEYMGHNLVATVVHSENCAWQAKIGDRIVLNGGGVIMPKLCTNQEMICMFAVAPLLPLLYVFQDRVSSDLDPNTSVWKRIQCVDTGVQHCGWGQITMEISAEKV